MMSLCTASIRAEGGCRTLRSLAPAGCVWMSSDLSQSDKSAKDVRAIAGENYPLLQLLRKRPGYRRKALEQMHRVDVTTIMPP
jgi:hypothetical protein